MKKYVIITSALLILSSLSFASLFLHKNRKTIDERVSPVDKNGKNFQYETKDSDNDGKADYTFVYDIRVSKTNNTNVTVSFSYYLDYVSFKTNKPIDTPSYTVELALDVDGDGSDDYPFFAGTSRNFHYTDYKQDSLVISIRENGTVHRISTNIEHYNLWSKQITFLVGGSSGAVRAQHLSSNTFVACCHISYSESCYLFFKDSGEIFKTNFQPVPHCPAAYDFFVTDDFSIITCGRFISNTISKIDSLGNIVWGFNTNTYTIFNRTALLSDGRIAVVGVLDYSGVSFFGIFNSNGTLIQSKIFSNANFYDSIATAIVEDENGYFVTQNFMDHKIERYWQANICYFNSNLDMLWCSNFPRDTRTSQLIRTSDGELLAIGCSNAYAWVTKIRTDGSVIWSSVFTKMSIPGYYTRLWEAFGLTGIIETSDNNYVAAGYDTCYKFDKSGKMLWSFTLPLTGIYAFDYFNEINDVIESADGCYVFVGKKYISNYYYSSPFVFKLSPNGKFE